MLPPSIRPQVKLEESALTEPGLAYEEILFDYSALLHVAAATEPLGPARAWPLCQAPQPTPF